MRTARLTLRHAVADDRTGFVDMLCDPLARAHLGGARSRADAQAALRPGLLRRLTFPEASYAVADRTTDAFIGTVSLIRRDPAHPGHIRPEGDELELSYALLPAFWGMGYASEATRALLSATAARHRDEPVIVVTQSSNVRSIALMKRLGFIEQDQFEQFGAQQTLAMARLSSFRPAAN